MALCCQRHVSTYGRSYRPIGAGMAALREKKVKQTDETLISGHFQNNLQVEGKMQKTRVWPQSTIGVEEYKDFIKRLECCKKELHKLYFRCPVVRFDYVEQMLSDLEKSTYQRSFSPNVYVSRKMAQRIDNLTQDPTNMKYYETTYGVYYNRIEELYRFKHLLLHTLPKHDHEQLKSEMRKICRTGKSTYHVDICVPAVYGAKKVLPGPIDRYTLRKP